MSNGISVKSFLKRLLKRPVMRMLRITLFEARLRRDWTAVSRVARRLGIAPLELERDQIFAQKKNSNTLFILGSGASVNRLTCEQFAEIEENYSVGINVWAAHDFIPDCYSFESGGFPPPSSELEHRAYLTQRLSEAPVVTKQPSFITLRPSYPSSREQFIKVPDGLSHREFVYGRVNLIESDENAMRADLLAITRRLLSRDPAISVLPDNGASVVRLIFLGVKLKFSKIVLVGVDLSDSPYFWYEEPYSESHPELMRLFPRSRGTPHDTLDQSRRPFNTRVLVSALADVLKTELRCEVLAAQIGQNWGGVLGEYSWQLPTRDDSGSTRRR